MRIDRGELLNALHAFVRAGSGLIIGDPGAGKSYALAELAERFEEERHPHLFILVEELGDVSEIDLQSALGYEEETFEAALRGLFSSGEEGTVIFDGFDAARNPAARKRLLNLIRSAIRAAPQHWAVVVSVRTYDASKSPTLLQLFSKGGATAGASAPASTTRHFVIPELDDSELESAFARSEQLKRYLERAPAAVSDIARNPFNLWLLENVLEAGVGPESLRPLSSQTELLLLFWRLKVAEGELADDRLAILNTIADVMVSERVLAVQRGPVFVPNFREAWRTLHSSGVLKEAGPVGSQVAFSHNILFDFAVSVLVLQDSAEHLGQFLQADVSRPLFLRPSLLHFFARLWGQDRDQFWKIFWTLLPSEDTAIRLVVRLLPPYVAVSEARSAADFKPVIERLEEDDPIAPVAVLRTLQALRFAPVEDPDVWVDVMVQLADAPSQTFAWDMMRTLNELVGDDHGVDQKSSISAITEKLFYWAWAHRTDADGHWYDNFASSLVLPTLLKWGQGDLIAQVIHRVLELLDEPRFPIRYFTTICDQAGALVDTVPALVGDLYWRVFLHEELSEEPTPLGGIVLPMTSNRKQDFSLCYYQLKQEYPAYLSKEPLLAVTVAFRLLDRFIQRRLSRFPMEGRSLEDLVFQVEFEDNRLSLLKDYGDDWLPHREEVKEIADRAQAELESETLPIEPAELVSVFLTDIRCVSVWSRLFRIGTAHPAAFVDPLSRLALVPGFVEQPTLARGLTAFVEKSYKYWPEPVREQFERSLFRIDMEGENSSPRRSLLRALPPDEVLLQETKAEKARLAQEPEEEPKLHRPAVSPAVRTVEYDYEKELLEQAGVDLSDPDVSSWREAAETLTRFRSNWLNDVPGEEEVADVIPTIRRLRAAVTPESEVAEVLVAQIWTALAGAAETASRLDSVRTGGDFGLIRSILLTAANDFSATTARSDEEYDTLHWSPSPRIAAAEGLPRLLLEGEDEEVQDAVEDLLRSPDPAERAVTLLHLPFARECCPDWFGTLVREAAEREHSRGVVRALFRSLRYVSSNRDETALALIASWKKGAADSPDVRRTLGDWLTYLVFRRDDDRARLILDSLLEDSGEAAADGILGEVVVQALHLLAAERFAQEDPEVVKRVVAWVTNLIEELQSKVEAADGEDQVAWLRVAHKLLERVVSRTYFNIRTGQGDSVSVDSQIRQRYYHAVRPILEAIVAFVTVEHNQGMVPHTAHYFVELMNEVLPFEPEKVLEMTRKVTHAAGTYGYHLDSLAVREMVRLVETLLADYRHLIVEPEALDDLLALLDQFADVGWPDALNLVWRLDEVFR